MYKIINRKKLAATMIADMVGKAVFWPRLLRKPEPVTAAAVRKILVIRTAYIGDVVMTLPLLQPLKAHFSDASLAFLTSSGAGPLLANNPYVDELITYNPKWFYGNANDVSYRHLIGQLRDHDFDLVIETRADIRELLAFVAPLRARHKVSYDVGGGGYLLTHVVPYPGVKHKVEYHLDIARHLDCQVSDTSGCSIYLTETEQADTQLLLAAQGIREPFACIHAGSRLPLKCWEEPRWSILCDRLTTETGMQIVLVGAEQERQAASRIAAGMTGEPCSFVGKLDLRELAGVLARAALFVCHDSGPMHIAAALSTPTVAIFGPSKSQETGPYTTKSRTVEEHFACRLTCDENSCKNDVRHACMKAIKPDDVMTAIRSILAENVVSDDEQ